MLIIVINLACKQAKYTGKKGTSTLLECASLMASVTSADNFYSPISRFKYIPRTTHEEHQMQGLVSSLELV